MVNNLFKSIFHFFLPRSVGTLLMFDALSPDLEVGSLLSTTLQTSFSYNSVESRNPDRSHPPVTMRIYNIDIVLIFKIWLSYLSTLPSFPPWQNWCSHGSLSPCWVAPSSYWTRPQCRQRHQPAVYCHSIRLWESTLDCCRQRRRFHKLGTMQYSV